MIPAVRWSTPEFETIVQLVSEQTGLVFPANRHAATEAGLRRAMARTGLLHAAAYRNMVSQDGAALDDLLAELTVGETYFFREPAQFTLLRKEIIPRLAERRRANQPIRVWSAACASGEEAYSLAITLRDLRPSAVNAVLGTDISRDRLTSARCARYRQWSLRGVPDAIIERYFRHHGKQYDLIAEARNDVEFRYLNLAADAYPSISTGVWGMDVIMCRNVLIYFDYPTIAHVGARLIESLSEDGWLLLGASDPVLSDFVQCEVVQTEAGLVYRRRGGQARMIAPPRRHVPVIQMTDSHVEPVVTDHTDTSATPPATDRVGTSEVAHTVSHLEADACATVRTFANLGRLAEADAACATALEQYGMSAELHYLHAVLLLQAGHAPESARAARRALYLDRSLVVAHLALASALSRTGALADARRSLTNAERLLEPISSDAIVPASDGESAAGCSPSHAPNARCSRAKRHDLQISRTSRNRRSPPLRRSRSARYPRSPCPRARAHACTRGRRRPPRCSPFGWRAKATPSKLGTSSPSSSFAASHHFLARRRRSTDLPLGAGMCSRFSTFAPSSARHPRRSMISPA